jgi:hypothetical protein
MKHKISRALLAALLLTMTAGAATSQVQPRPVARVLPNPILYLTAVEFFTNPSGSFIRYRYDVFNKSDYPASMFAAAPGLPPCGANSNSSRTWVDILANGTNQRLQTFCALGSPNDLSQIWFALPQGQIPPSYVYMEMTDRQTNTKYRSNLADTVM